MTGSRFFDSGNADYFHIAVSRQCASQCGCHFAEFHLASLPNPFSSDVTLTARMSEHRTVLRSTSTISIITFISRVFGFIRDSRIAFLLGTGDFADAYTIAYRIPNLIRRLVGEGAVSSAFIPVFSEYLAEGKRAKAWEFANTILSAALVLLTLITILGILFSPWIVPLFAHGFNSTPGKYELTIVLNRIMFAYIGLIGISALAMGVLQSFNRFAASALAPVLLNLSVIGFSFLSGFFSSPAVAMAVGVVVGGVLQVAIQLPGLIQSGWHFRWIWIWPIRACGEWESCWCLVCLRSALCTSM
jgi:putative peptidoglycan lipid II flippase